MFCIHRILQVTCLAAVLAACTADGGTSNQIFRPFQWFSYANGDDIRENCAPGRNARYRMIYNAIYDKQVVVISLDDLIAIEKALVASGFEKPAIDGQILHSDSFYWIAMVCRDGNFKYYAWNDENADIAKLPFREVLSKGDETGVPFQEPFVPVTFSRNSRYYNGGAGSTYFTMQVRDNGLDL